MIMKTPRGTQYRMHKLFIVGMALLAGSVTAASPASAGNIFSKKNKVQSETTQQVQAIHRAMDRMANIRIQRPAQADPARPAAGQRRR